MFIMYFLGSCVPWSFVVFWGEIKVDLERFYMLVFIHFCTVSQILRFGMMFQVPGFGESIGRIFLRLDILTPIFG